LILGSLQGICHEGIVIYIIFNEQWPDKIDIVIMGTTHRSFAQSISHLLEFIILNGFLPNKDIQNDEEQARLGRFISSIRTQKFRGKLTDYQINELNNVHPGILASKLSDDVKIPDYLDDMWNDVFQSIANKDKDKAYDIVNYTYASTAIPFVPFGMSSYEEYIIRSSGCHALFKPSDCHPSIAKPGTIQGTFSCMLYPEHYNYLSEANEDQFTYNIVDNTPLLNHTYNDSIFPKEKQPTELQKMIDNAVLSILPPEFINALKDCKSASEIKSLLQSNDKYLDNLHFPEGARGPELVNLTDTCYNQPRRVGCSVTIGDIKYLPTLGTKVRRLLTYGANRRPDADMRSRPMTKELYDLSIAVWNYTRKALSPISKVCPVNNWQVLVYFDTPSDNDSNQYNGDMALHHDFGIIKPNGKNHLGVVETTRCGHRDKKLASHTYGTDIVQITSSLFGGMNFLQIKPDYTKGEQYDITQDRAKEILATRNRELTEQMKGNSFDRDAVDLVHKTYLPPGSIYIHTPHNDEMYHHGLEFPKVEKRTKIRIRVALVGRILAVPAYFRADEEDGRCNRYAMMGRYVFDKLDNQPIMGPNWWRVLGYVDDNGINIMKRLMRVKKMKDKKSRSAEGVRKSTRIQKKKGLTNINIVLHG